ncbi:hypothetical protein BDW66DRAFT_148708 [Aspergillus desertorum]
MQLAQSSSSNHHHARPAVELIAVIIDHLESDRTSHARFSRTKRCFYIIATPRLNRSVVIRDHQGLAYGAMLSRLPGIAAAVKSLTLHYHGDDSCFTFVTQAVKALSGLEKLAVKGGGPAPDSQPFRVHKWHVFRRQFRGDAEKRRLSPSQDAYVSPGTWIYQLTGGSVELNLTDNVPWSCDIDALMAHPTLQRLSILGAHIFCGDFSVPCTRGTGLEELTLLCCDFSADTLTKALAIPRGLRRFTCKGDVLGSPTNGRTPRTEPESCIAALRKHKGTLEAPDIDFWPFQNRYPDPLDMRAFSKLQSFKVRVEELYSRMLYQLPLAECLLPRRLQELVLDDLP